MTAIAANFDFVISNTYDLRMEINRGVGIYSKDEIITAKNIVEDNIGKELIKEKNPGIFFFDTQDSNKIIVIDVVFAPEDIKTCEMCINTRFWIQHGEIIQIMRR